MAHVTAVQWPALIFISAMATPITLFVLGPLWTEVTPLAQILALALKLNFTSTLNFPILVAVGAIRSTVPIAISRLCCRRPLSYGPRPLACMRSH